MQPAPSALSHPEGPPEFVAEFLVFGDSLKIQALRHVLDTLEMKALKEGEIQHHACELRIAFDGCDADACLKKARFIREFAGAPPRILQFPIGRVPNIAPLFEPDPKIPKHQGTIFDPNVQVYADCWRNHDMRRFLEKNGPETIGNYLTQAFRTRVPELAQYIASSEEQIISNRIIELVQMLETKIAGWQQIKVSGDATLLRARLAAWSEAKRPRRNRSDPGGPLHQFCKLLCDLDDILETTVPRLAQGVAEPNYTFWRDHLARLP